MGLAHCDFSFAGRRIFSDADLCDGRDRAQTGAER
jgi:hypothetical protein